MLKLLCIDHKIDSILRCDLLRGACHAADGPPPQLVPRHNWSPGPSAANYVAVDGPPGPSIAAMDGPLCRKCSPCSKPEKQWLQLKIDLYIYMLTGEFGD